MNKKKMDFEESLQKLLLYYYIRRIKITYGWYS